MKQTSGYQKKMTGRKFVALLCSLMLLISSSGITAFADDGIYSDPVTAPGSKTTITPAPETTEETPASNPEDNPEENPEESAEPAEGDPEVTEEPDAQENQSGENVPEDDGIVYQAGSLTAELEDCSALIEYTADAHIPEETTLTLRKAEGMESYACLKSANKLLKNQEDETWKDTLADQGNQFYYLSLMNAEGEVIKPASGVILTFQQPAVPEGVTYVLTGEAPAFLENNDGIIRIVDYAMDPLGYVTINKEQIGNVTLTHKGADFTVTATYGPDAGFPAETEMQVREILPGTEEYTLYSGMTDEALNEDWAEITLERYFDIAFVVNGEEREPQGYVDVQILFSEKIEKNEETEVQAVHIQNNEATIIESETDSNEAAVSDSEAIDTVTFSSDSFSVYGVVQKKKIIKKVLAADGNTYEINVTYGPEAEIPENAQVQVEEIPEGSDLWEAYRKQTAAALGADDVRLPGLYDITIVDEAGEKVTPQAPVNVAFKLINEENISQDLQVVHFKEEIPQELVEAESKPEEPATTGTEEQPKAQTEEQTVTETTEQTEAQVPVQPEPLAEEDKIASETIIANVEGDTITFETDGFSVYAFAYTVDFHYEDEEGKVYEWSYPGRGKYPVTDVLNAIGGEGEITDVTLELKEGELVEGALYLTKEEDQWFLNSDVAFTDTYELRITTTNGIYCLSVTDAWEDIITVNNSAYGLIKRNIDDSYRSEIKLRELFKNRENGEKNRYKLIATANPNYTFSYWTINGNRWKTENQVNSEELTWSNETSMALQAVFGEALRGFDVDESSIGKGSYSVGNGTTTGSVIVDWNRDFYIDSNRKNKVSFEAYPNDGYEFIGWYYYKQDIIRDTWVHTDTFYDQVINPGSFNMDRNENWFMKPVFGNADTFTVQCEGHGHLNGKYFDEPDHQYNVDGETYAGRGQFTDQYRNQSRFSYGFTPKPDDGYKFAFWIYSDQNGKIHQLDKIDNKTVIPYDGVVLTAYFIPEDTKLFYYRSDDESKGAVNPNKTFTSENGTATPANNSLAFIGWYDEDNHLISTEATFNTSTAAMSMVLTAKFRTPGQARYNIVINDSNAGRVVDSNNSTYQGWQQTTYEGKIDRIITAVPADGYEFIRWELNGAELYQYPRTIDPNYNPLFLINNDELKAVFQQATFINKDDPARADIVLDDARKQELQQWLESLKQGKVISGDKTAHVVDNNYTNRIYQINFDVESALLNLTADIDIAFIIDASNSILFPANLVKTDKAMVLTQSNLNEAFPKGGTYYIISDPDGTSTVYRIYRESDGFWYAVDSSYDNIKRFRVEAMNTYAEKTYSAPYKYPIYQAADGYQRKYYMQTSLTNTLSSLKGILGNITQAGGTTKNIRIAWDTFAHDIISSNDFQNLNDNFNITINQTAGGTHQDKGLDTAREFNWGSTQQKYAILITDGAPNDSTVSDIFSDVARAATDLKNTGVKLITVGLSTRNVSAGSVLLKQIASEYETGKKMYFEADSGNDLESVLMEALQMILAKRTVSGEITDYIDPAFYPVDSNGIPLQAGYYNLDGTPFNGDGDAARTERYKLEYDSSRGAWKVTYKNLWITDHRTLSIQVKAKEDFLGGNTINTNLGEAEINPIWWLRDLASNDWVTFDKNKVKNISLPSPKVNVDELKFTNNHSDETVHLGEHVKPQEKLQLLYENIQVEEVVSETGTDHRRTNNSLKITDSDFIPETYNLSTVTGTLTSDQWNILINNGTVDIPYSAYGHNGVGTINLSLTKTANVDGATVAYNDHETTAVGSPAETYTISAVYTPASSGAATTYDHTTVGKSAGELTEDIESVNEHIINVIDSININILKNWKNSAGASATAPSDARVEIILGRYKLVDEGAVNPPQETCTISFNANGGSGSMASVTINKGETYTLPECTFGAPDGFEFDRWNLGNSGSTVTINSDTRLLAQWKSIAPETWTISFDGNGGSGSMSPETVIKGEQYTLPECDFQAPNGKVFDGWNLGNPGSKVPINGDTTIQAQWKNSTKTINIVTNGIPNGATLQVFVQMQANPWPTYGETENLTVSNSSCQLLVPDDGKKYQLCFKESSGDWAYVTSIESTPSNSYVSSSDVYNIYNLQDLTDGSTISINCIEKVKVQYQINDVWNNAVHQTVNGESTNQYTVGSSVTITFYGGQTWDQLANTGRKVQYNGADIAHQFNQNTKQYSVTFTVTKNAVLVIPFNFNTSGCPTINWPNNSGIKRQQQKTGLLELLIPVAYAEEASIHLPSAAPTLPEAPEGKVWDLDSSWDSTDRVVTLNNGNNWQQTKAADATDSDGNIYLYYIDEVHEYNVDPSTWTAVKDNFLVWGDYTTNTTHSNANLSVTNTSESGNLKVSKQVTGNIGEKDKEFHFTVTLGDASVNGVKGDMTFTNGEADITLKDGESKTATGLPAEITYTVTETEANQDGYTTTIPSNSSGTIPAGDTAEVLFVNYKNDDYGHLTVNKILAGQYDPALLTETYEIGVKGADGNYYDGNGQSKGTEPYYLEVEGGHSVVWSNLPPQDYIIEEKDQDYGGFVVTPTGLGTINIPAGQNPNIDVVNTFHYPVSVHAKKIWNAGEPALTRAVQFTLMRQAEAQGQPMAVEEEGIENPVTVHAGNNWEYTWTNLDKYSDNLGHQYSYFVVETGVYYGNKDVNLIEDNEWTSAAITYVDGSSVGFDNLGQGTVSIKNIEKTNVPVTKTWDNYTDSEYSWTVSFQLQQKEVLASGSEASDAITDWTNVEDKTLTLNKNNVTFAQFDNLDVIRVHSNGSIYRILYRAEEIAYQVDKTEGGTTTTIARWDKNDATLLISDNGTNYEPYYAQNAGEDMTITDLRTRYSIVVENKPKADYSDKLVVHKEWLDIYPADLKYYPAVFVDLYRVPIDPYNNSMGIDKYAQAELIESHHKLSFADNWTWVIEGLPDEYRYFVIESNYDLGGNYNRTEHEIRTGLVIETDPSYDSSRDPSMGITVQAYKARDKYGEGTWRSGNWQEAIYAYTGNSGEILIQNNAPSKYMQMDLKKKFLEYRLDPQTGVYSLWTTTAEYDTMKDMIIEIQIMRRMVDESNNTIVNGGWKPYGNTIFVGYDAQGKEYINANKNLFQVISGDGTWHFRIPSNEQKEGLPRRGYQYVDGTLKLVRYQYILKEVQVYNGSLVKIGDDWAAWLPWYWDGIQDTPYQAEEHIPATAQDQDRLFNTPGTKLYIEKEWNIPADDVDVKEIYVKVYRKLKNGSEEDFIKYMCDYMGSGLEPDYLEGNASGTLDADNYRLVLGAFNDWSAVLHKVPISTFEVSKGEYEYYIKEVGYKDSKGDIHNSADIFTPAYYTQVDGGTETQVQQGEGMILQWRTTNKLKVKNTIDVVNVPVQKTWEGGTPDINAAIDVELVKVVNGSEVPFEPAKKLTLTANSDSNKNWKGIFTSLAKTENDQPITYRVKETRVVLGGMEYTRTNLETVFGQRSFEISSDQITSSTVAEITNQIEKKHISAKKQWNGTETWGDKLSVEFTLYQKTGTDGEWTSVGETDDGRYGANTPSVTVASTDTNKTVSWSNLPKWTFVSGDVKEIFYKVEETSVTYDGEELVTPFYTVYDVDKNDEDVNGLVIINNIPKTTERHAVKDWDDNNNEKGLRPQSITFTLTAEDDNGTVVDLTKYTFTGDNPQTVTVDGNQNNMMHADWTGLPVYTKEGRPITYACAETAVTYYSLNDDIGYDEDTFTWAFTNTLNEVNLKIIKDDSTDNTKKLSGAVFELRKKDSSGEYVPVTGASVYGVNTEGKFTVDQEITLTGITDGEYKITEITPPTGYIRYNGELLFTVANGDIEDPDIDGTVIRYTAKTETEAPTLLIANVPAAELPATGGSGTLIYTIAGLALILLAGVLLISRRKWYNNR